MLLDSALRTALCVAMLASAASSGGGSALPSRRDGVSHIDNVKVSVT